VFFYRTTNGQRIPDGAATYHGPPPWPGDSSNENIYVKQNGQRIPIPPGLVAPTYRDLDHGEDDDEGDDSGNDGYGGSDGSWRGTGGGDGGVKVSGENEERDRGSSEEVGEELRKIPESEDTEPESRGGFKSQHLSPEGDQRLGSRESTPSGSDYDTTRKALLNARTAKARRGRECSDTEKDDDEEDEELRNEVVNDSYVSPKSRNRFHTQHRNAHSKSNSSMVGRRVTAKQRGKRRVVVPPGDGDGVPREEVEAARSQHSGTAGGDAGDVRDVNAEEDWARAKGPLSAAAKSEIAVFGSRTYDEAKGLAKKYGKDISEVMVQAGLGFRWGRSSQMANQFRRWYSLKFPGPDGGIRLHYCYFCP
jgi:hypothetical protein